MMMVRVSAGAGARGSQAAEEARPEAREERFQRHDAGADDGAVDLDRGEVGEEGGGVGEVGVGLGAEELEEAEDGDEADSGGWMLSVMGLWFGGGRQGDERT